VSSRAPAPGATRSFWLEEALANDAGEPCPPLTSNVVADVCVVGGGFAGLWTAIELSVRDSSLRIALIEQDICGGGASGRNGGFFSSSWWDAPAICALFGDEEGMRYLHAVADTVEDAGAWFERHDIDAWFHHEGALRVATGTWQLEPEGSSAAEFLATRGEGDRLRQIGPDEARAIADSPRFVSGWFGPDSAVVQPARLARGLRRIALQRGVRIFERSAMTGLERSRPAVVRTTHGAVKAAQVVLTTGAWAAGWPGFRRSFGVIVDQVVATEPIPELLREIGWTSQIGIGDCRELLYYLRPTDDGRIVIGGGALGVVFGGRPAGARSPTMPVSPRQPHVGSHGCSRSSQAFVSRTHGEDRSIRRRRSCHSSARSNRATCTLGSGSRGTGCRRRWWAVASLPRSRRGSSTSGPRCPSSARKRRHRRNP
jgi:glycine/D-amino acid oxidase-like deaminating enzyme